MLGLYAMLGCHFKLCYEISIWIVFYVEGCGVSSAECHIYLVSVKLIIVEARRVLVGS